MDTASHERSYEGTQTRPISSGTSNLTHGGPGFDNLTPDKHRETRRRTKTGCLTCRKRRIKCDEGKPDCLRCLKSKRPCEGYNSKTVFRNENQQHYQQSIRPSPAGNSSTQKSSYTTPSNVQFSIPQYQSMAQPGFSSYSHQVPSMSLLSGAFESPHESGQLLSSNKMPLTFNSRNSSASNASGVSANSEQRRISVLSLISSDTKDDYPSAERPARSNNSHIVLPQISPRLPPVSEARDNFFYNLYVLYQARALAQSIPVGSSINQTNRAHPTNVWTSLVPSMINDDPPGKRPLFDSVVAYTAQTKFEEILIDHEIRSTGDEARLLEVALKAFIDIVRGTADMVYKIDMIFDITDDIRIMLRWGILHHIVSSCLADTNPRPQWMSYVANKVINTASFVPSNDIQRFYLLATRHMTTSNRHLPTVVLELQHNYEFLSTAGIDIIYFAFIGHFDAVKNIAHNMLSTSKSDDLFMAYRMVSGACLRGHSEMDILAKDLSQAVRQYDPR